MNHRNIARRSKAYYKKPGIVKKPFRVYETSPDRIPLKKPKRLVELYVKAARKGDIEKVQGFLDMGIDVDAKNEDGWTALMVACGNGRMKIARFLIRNGARINAQAGDGWTALMWASFFGQTSMAKLLLENGADVNLTNNKGNTALKLTAVYGHTTTAMLLREAEQRRNQSASTA